jgi:Ca2+-binding EF-hand superfamily protein
MKLRQRYTMDTGKFNALSVAIISAAAMYMPMAHAQTTAPSQPAPAPTAPAAPAATSPDNARYMEAFARADKNADGKLSKEEAENLPAIAQRFDQIDADKDGSISQAEYLTALKN